MFQPSTVNCLVVYALYPQETKYSRQKPCAKLICECSVPNRVGIWTTLGFLFMMTNVTGPLYQRYKCEIRAGEINFARSDWMHLKRAGPHLSLPHDDDDDDDEHADSTCTLQERERERMWPLCFFERGKNVTNPPFKCTSVTSSFSTIQQYFSGNLMSLNSTHLTGL